MNLRILFKSFRLAFRARKRVIAFIIIYAILFISVGKGLQAAMMTPGAEWPWLAMAFIVATVYAILISQFRARDIAILKCVSWSNSEILLLLVGEVMIVAISAYLVVFQLSVEILGIVAYFETDFGLLRDLQELIVVEAVPMLWTLLYVVFLQIPGLALARWRAMKIPPMRALREE
ncbi:MAG: hypothetical protein DRO73_04575 [Candidatus Thorarchaeota archaeon]|nr:MAG: hypothetical protein DRO73_04575 [Candidatus Thorarchaeota archaeon]RLI62117.1 MAG: hypothetical protein DRO93_02270 [Candidatus Thorarchaeota archaeon]